MPARTHAPRLHPASLAGVRLQRKRRRGSELHQRRHFELLEARNVLASVFWNVDSSGFWDDASNWRDETGANRLPATGDDVFLTRPAGTFTITYRAGTTA